MREKERKNEIKIEKKKVRKRKIENAHEGNMI